MIRELSYHEAIRSSLAGKTVILLPLNVNPHYLAWGAQKYHPCAGVLHRADTYKDQVEDYSFLKRAVLETFAGEKGISRTKVTAWEVS